jgi:hypothetical protein
MSDTAIAEVPADPVPPVPPAPEATAELEAAVFGQVVIDLKIQGNDRNGKLDDASSPVEAPGEQVAERALPFADVEHLGVLRRAVLDALADADEPLSVARIIAELPPGTTRGSAESAIKREWDAGRIERVGPGLYVLAKSKPPNQPKPAPQPPPTPTE